MCQRIEWAQLAAKEEIRTKMEDTPLTDMPLAGTTGKHDRLDDTLCPPEWLSRTMSLEEATKWLKNFEIYLNWNGLVIAKKSPESLQDLLESSLDTGLVSKLQTDESVTKETTVRGPTGILAKLKGYFIYDYPLVILFRNFRTCKQAR